MERDAEEIRLVVDTNVIISALLKDDSLTARLLRTNACFTIHGRPNEIDYYREYIVSKRARHSGKSFEHALHLFWVGMHCAF
jgi:hypothetical protein